MNIFPQSLKRHWLASGWVIFIFATSAVVAGEQDSHTKSPQKQWQGEGDLAYNRASGNSESEALLVKLKLSYQQQRWTHTGQIEAVNTSENDTRSAESYTLKAKTDYDISAKRYSFAAFRYEDNRYSGYEYQSSLSIGMGLHVIDAEPTRFDIEGGVGFRRSETFAEASSSGEAFNEAIFLGSANYARTLTDTTTFESAFNVESGADNTYGEIDVALKVRISSQLALKVAYGVKHNTDVPTTTKNTDTQSSVGLNYQF